VSKTKRHRWDTIKEGFVRCIDCGLEIHVRDRKRGGVGACIPNRKGLQREDAVNDFLVVCDSCKKLVPAAIVCIYCGNLLQPLGFKSKRL